MHVKLHPDAVAALESIPKMSDSRWFWTGNGKLQTAVTHWQGRFLELFRDAGIVDDAGKVDGHAHRFRHTFACDLLSQGVPIRQVAAFLGNSVTIVEKHYGGWSEEQQRQADEALERTFLPVRDGSATALERVAKSARLVTRKLHGRREVN